MSSAFYTISCNLVLTTTPWRWYWYSQVRFQELRPRDQS
jgi:hypothetical protein